MPEDNAELFETAYEQWKRGKNLTAQVRELFIMLSHTIGTCQWIIQVLGLTEIAEGDTIASAQKEDNSTAGGSGGIDLTETEGLTNGTHSP